MQQIEKLLNHIILLHFVAFFHVASLFYTGFDNKKVGVDNGKALEMTNGTVFHTGRQ
jgi:ABC-type xylose transport system substrate-binding protein